MKNTLLFALILFTTVCSCEIKRASSFKEAGTTDIWDSDERGEGGFYSVGNNSNYPVVVVRGCEYIRLSNNCYVHKGNCKFCLEREKQRDKALLEAISKINRK